MIRLGLIGHGAWGRRYLESAPMAGVEISFVAGRNWREFPIRRCDGIIVATPPEPRAVICVELARLDIPMMVEKPLCLSTQEVLAVQAAMGSSTTPFLVDYVHLFAPAYERLRQEVRGRLGRVRVYSRIAHPTERSYSKLWDHAPHDLTMCLGLGLTPVEAVSSIPGELDVRFDDDAELHLRVVRGDRVRRFMVVCGGWSAVYDGTDNSLLLNGERQLMDSERPLTCALRAFAKAIAEGGTDDWRFGIDSSVTITRMLEHAQTGLACAAG